MTTHAEIIPIGIGRSVQSLARFRGKTVVLKLGGAAMESSELDEFTAAISKLRSTGCKVVVVHGGGAEITRMAALLGIETTFVGGQRHTCAETMGVVLMVLAG